jgi:hypothetical protein
MMFRPKTSSDRQPYSFSANGFQYVTTPDKSVAMTAALTQLRNKLRSRISSALGGFADDFTTEGLDIDSSMERTKQVQN